MEQNRREFLKSTLLASAVLALPGAVVTASLPVKSSPDVEFDWNPEIGQADLRYETTKHDLELDTGNPLDQAEELFNWLVREQKLHLYPAMLVFGIEPDLYNPVPGQRGFLSHHSEMVVCSMEQPERALRDLSMATMFMASELLDVCRYETVKGFTLPYIEAIDRHKSHELLGPKTLQSEEEVEELLDEPHVCLCVTTHVYVPDIASEPAEERLIREDEDGVPDFRAATMRKALKESYEYHGSIFN